MVPVPEDLADGVERFLMVKQMMARGVALDRDELARMLASLDARCRSVLSVIAEAKVSNGDISIAELARTMRWTEHETVGVVYELSELVLALFGPLVVLASTESPDGAAGNLDWEKLTVFVHGELAHLVAPVEGLSADAAS